MFLRNVKWVEGPTAVYLDDSFTLAIAKMILNGRLHSYLLFCLKIAMYIFYVDFQFLSSFSHFRGITTWVFL